MSTLSRRDLIARAAIVGTALVTSVSAQDPSPQRTASNKQKVIVTGGHPGDPEYGCGGTIASLTARGDEVVLLYLNTGEPEGTPPEKRGIRTREAQKACSLLKARPLFAGQIDGSAIVDQPHYKKFRELLEHERPTALFTHWPIENHPDHRAISNLVYDAWLHMNKSFSLYYYEVSNGSDTMQFAPNCYVDISNHIDLKRQACFAHASQSPEKFFQLQQSVTRFRGIESGTREAEAFTHHLQSPTFQLP
jgi:LmbE family N-acetylglucosaminyl deacetylase